MTRQDAPQKTMLPAQDRIAREAATLDRLHEAMDRDAESTLAEAIKRAVEERAREEGYALSAEMAALLGRHAEALPDTIVLLYLREVPAITVGQLRAHLERLGLNPDLQLKLMGLWRLDAAAEVPRPRVFPRSMLVADLRRGDLMGRATANRTLQLLSALGLTTEAPSGPNGALDVQVNQRLLELLEEAVLAVRAPVVKGHRLSVRVPTGAEIVRSFQALFLAGLLSWAALTAAPGWAHAPQEPIPVLVPQVTTPLPLDRSASVGLAVGSFSAEPEIQLAALSQVLRDSLLLTGPQPRPAPIETGN